MSKFTDNKDIYADFKYFKNIYTKINIAENIQFTGNSASKSISVIFLRDSSFSELFGTFTGETKFFDWLLEGDKTVLFKMEDIIKIGKCLKKNAVDIEYDDTTFQYNFIDKDGNTTAVTLSVTNPLTLKTKEKNFNSTFELGSDYFATDILEVFSSEGSVTKSRTKDKIIEIPKDRISSLLKGETTMTIKFTEKDEIGSRLVSLSSKNDELCLELVENFRTI